MKRAVATAFLAVSLAVGAAPARSETVAEDWKVHLVDDLLPFWAETTAAGSGSFPGRLCDDGSTPVPGTSCDGVMAWEASNPVQTVVGQSRQVYSYAVAFHMTGEAAYLDLARKGADYLFDTFVDPSTGLFSDRYSVSTGTLSDGTAIAQKQAYGLLGPAMLYYLTGDPILWGRIEGVEAEIGSRFLDTASGAFSRTADAGPSAQLVDHLDQLNAYKTMLAEFAPSTANARLLDEALTTARYLRQTFHDPATGLMLLDSRDPTGTLADASLGHAIKTYWFMDQIALLAGDGELSRFARAQARRVFTLAYRDGIGAWTTVYDALGAPGDIADWWSFAELNQFLAALAPGDPALEAMLAETQGYWLDTFVDRGDGGIFTLVDLSSGTSVEGSPKHFEWKAGFHSYEHALVNYLATAARTGAQAELWFARQDGAAPGGLSYGFEGTALTGALDASGGIQRVLFEDIAYAAPAAVPLPGGAVLVLSTLLGLGLMSRRARAARIA